MSLRLGQPGILRQLSRSSPLGLPESLQLRRRSAPCEGISCRRIARGMCLRCARKFFLHCARYTGPHGRTGFAIFANSPPLLPRIRHFGREVRLRHDIAIARSMMSGHLGPFSGERAHRSMMRKPFCPAAQFLGGRMRVIWARFRAIWSRGRYAIYGNRRYMRHWRYDAPFAGLAPILSSTLGILRLGHILVAAPLLMRGDIRSFSATHLTVERFERG